MTKLSDITKKLEQAVRVGVSVFSCGL